MKNHKKIRNTHLSFRAPFVALLLAAGWNVGVAAAGSGTQDFDEQMQPIVERYLAIGDALSSDSMEGVRKNAETIAKLAVKLDPGSVSGEHADHYKSVPGNLERAARGLGKAEGLEKAREAFKKVSQPMAMWATMSKPKGLDVVYCSMAKASWVQRHGKIRNPYYGAKMLDCGEVVGGDRHQGHEH